MKREKRKGTGFQSGRDGGRIAIADLKNQVRQIKRDLLSLGRIQEELEELQLPQAVWTNSVT